MAPNDVVVAWSIVCGGFSLTFLALTAAAFFIGETLERRRQNTPHTPRHK